MADKEDSASVLYSTVPVDDTANLEVVPALTASMLTSKNKKKPKRKRKNNNNNGTKKPSDAPKRFKSSFIFFSMEKHREIKAKIAREGTKNTGINITSLVSQAWRALESTEREKFEIMARIDKERYSEEKKKYVPPTGGNARPIVAKRKREPGSPKRPMSAYLSYANKLRGQVKRENPTSTNGELSKILSGMWKQIPDNERKILKDNEKLMWDAYRMKMQEWRNKSDKQKKNMNVDFMCDEEQPNNTVGKGRKKRDVSQLKIHELIDFSSSHHHHQNHHHYDEIDNDPNADDQLVGLSSVIPGMDSNPNTTDEMMAASALRGVRGGDTSLTVSSSNFDNNGYGTLFGVNTPMNFPHSQYNYPLGVENSHAMIMAQLRGASNANPYQSYTGLTTMDQQPNLSQLASLAGVQNNASHDEKIRNSVLNDNSDISTQEKRY